MSAPVNMRDGIRAIKQEKLQERQGASSSAQQPVDTRQSVAQQQPPAAASTEVAKPPPVPLTTHHSPQASFSPGISIHLSDLQRMAETDRTLSEMEKSIADAALEQSALEKVTDLTSSLLPSVPGAKHGMKLTLQKTVRGQQADSNNPDDEVLSPPTADLPASSTDRPSKRMRESTPGEQPVMDIIADKRALKVYDMNLDLKKRNKALEMELEDVRMKMAEMDVSVGTFRQREDQQAAWLAKLSRFMASLAQNAPTGYPRRELVEIQAACLAQSFDLTVVPDCEEQAGDFISENMRLLKGMVDGLFALKSQSLQNWQKTHDEKVKYLSQRLRTMEDSMKKVKETLLPKGGEEMEEWATFKNAISEAAMVAAARFGWLRVLVLKDDLFKAFVPSRMEEISTAFLSESQRSSHRRDYRQSLTKGKGLQGPPSSAFRSSSAQQPGPSNPASALAKIDPRRVPRQP